MKKGVPFLMGGTNMAGTVINRGNNRWELRISMGYDENGKRAGILKKRYERLAEERRQLDREMNSASSEAASILREARSEEGRFEQACKSVREMNTMAQNRKAANELKQQIEAAWKEIPQDWGQKFFAGRQSELKSKLSARRSANH